MEANVFTTYTFYETILWHVISEHERVEWHIRKFKEENLEVSTLVSMVKTVIFVRDPGISWKISVNEAHVIVMQRNLLGRVFRKMKHLILLTKTPLT